MCKIVDDYAKEYHEEKLQETVIAALKDGVSPEIVARVTRVPLEKVMELVSQTK